MGDGTNEGGAAAAAPAEAAAPAVIDYKAKLLALLGLDDTADEAAIDAKIAEVKTQITETLPQAQTAATDASTKLQEATTNLQNVQQQFDDLQKQWTSAQKAKDEAEADAILEQFADRLDDKAKARIRAILLNDKEAGVDILNGLPKPAAAPAEPSTPPAPVHTDKAPAAEMSAEEKIAKQNELIRKIQAEGKFKDYDSARAEARRRDASLFS